MSKPVSRLKLTRVRRIQGYAVFLRGNWSVVTFIFNYGIVS
jgi:hypothetical protein